MKLGLPDVEIPAEDAVTQDRLVNQALISAVHAFSARWLPLSCFGEVNQPKSPHLLVAKEHFVECIWKRAQKDVEKVLTIPSYRSILALYLFGVTPTSSKNAERQIADYCMETALRHYVRLRARKCITASSVVPVGSDMTQDFGSNDRIIGTQDAHHEEHQHLEDTAYWFGIVIDGSRALTRCQPSVLLPGLTGDSRVWDLIKRQSENSANVFRSISSAKTLLTDETVTIMVQYGFQCKTLFWKAVSRLQECLFYQSIEVSLAVVLGDIEREITRFEKNFTHFLDKCGRDYILLSVKSRINYFDTLDWHHEVFQRDLTIDVEAHRLSSTRAIVTSINLMLSQSDTFAGDDPTSIILKDPYPEHTRNGLSRAAYSVLKMYAASALPKQVAEIMASSLFAGLEVLKQISYSATESLNGLYEEYAKSDLTLKRRQPVPSTNLTAVPSTYGVALTPELFEEATFRQLDLAGEDPFLVNKTIGRHEVNEQTDDFAWFDLDGADLEWMNQDWSFQDCFSSA
ncbi:hypothetical protein LTR84_000162 [Exophiala bonariae]|uniref:Transcription factor domain-containing protein n=1 Tax=Exophiala bonariae TaxID=1690606 RepID=A0AAV9NPT2_9EURO|nr:hypothetical protein LTR84_000162 [Exophiala bonariae]